MRVIGGECPGALQRPGPWAGGPIYPAREEVHLNPELRCAVIGGAAGLVAVIVRLGVCAHAEQIAIPLKAIKKTRSRAEQLLAKAEMPCE